MVENPTLPYSGYDVPENFEHPEPSGRVYIIMKSMVTGELHTYIKQHKTDDVWAELTPFTEIETCWAFSKQGAKRIIDRLKTKTYKTNYDKGLVKFETMDKYTA